MQSASVETVAADSGKGEDRQRTLIFSPNSGRLVGTSSANTHVDVLFCCGVILSARLTRNAPKTKQSSRHIVFAQTGFPSSS